MAEENLHFCEREGSGGSSPEPVGVAEESASSLLNRTVKYTKLKQQATRAIHSHLADNLHIDIRLPPV
jgi:hypothetical protein